MYGVAACKDAQGQTSDAIDDYRRVASSFANTFIAFQAKLALAGLYESQDKAKEALGVCMMNFHYRRFLFPTAWKLVPDVRPC